MEFNSVTVARFWDKVEKSEGCWEWKASFVTGGYGYFRYAKKHGMAHRFSYMLHFGEIPEGKLVCHHCDNPRCVRPEHLFLGTIRDNTVHAAEHALIPRGSDTTFAKLTEDQVTELKTLFSQGWSMNALGKRYGIHGMNVGRILRGTSWKYHPMRTSIDTRPS